MLVDTHADDGQQGGDLQTLTEVPQSQPCELTGTGSGDISALHRMRAMGTYVESLDCQYYPIGNPSKQEGK